MKLLKLHHFVIPWIAIVAFMFGGILNGGGIGWYGTLSLPSWHPPSIVIAIVWAFIYLFAALAAILVWNTDTHDSRFRRINLGFTSILLLNFLWSLLFFTLHYIFAAVWCAVVLAIATAALMAVIWPRSRAAALLLAPYFLWVVFAAYLNYAVGMLNL